MNLNDVLVFCRLENSASNIAGSPRKDGPGAADSNASSLLEVLKICHTLFDIHCQNLQIYTHITICCAIDWKSFHCKGNSSA